MSKCMASKITSHTGLSNSSNISKHLIKHRQAEMPFGSIGISIPLNYPSVTRDGKRIDTGTETKAAAQENMREDGKKNEKGT